MSLDLNFSVFCAFRDSQILVEGIGEKLGQTVRHICALSRLITCSFSDLPEKGYSHRVDRFLFRVPWSQSPFELFFI